MFWLGSAGGAVLRFIRFGGVPTCYLLHFNSSDMHGGISMIAVAGTSEKVGGWTMYRCTTCSAEIHSPYSADRVHCGCRQRSQCVSLGAEQRQQECSTCCGNVRIKVFACAVHGECQAAPSLEGIADCWGCRDYELVNEAPSSNSQCRSASGERGNLSY